MSTRRHFLSRGATALAALSAAGLTGCAQYYYGEAAAPHVDALRKANHRATDQLVKDILLDPQRAVLVGTVVDIDRLDSAARLGRVCTEQIMGRLAQQGIRVVEPRLRDVMSMRPLHGEMLLSRELHEVGRAHDAQAVIVGTYAVSSNAVYVSLKLVDAASSHAVAAVDYTLALDNNLRTLLLEYR